MGRINYVIGDATKPQGEGNKIICHICNNKNRWGAGFVLAISAKWSAPESVYRSMSEYVLGDVTIVQVEANISVANMIAQHDTKPIHGGSYGIKNHDEIEIPPIRYEALKDALTKVNIEAKRINATIHMPRIGTGLAGGVWSIIELIIKDVVTVDVTVYDLS